MVYKYELAALFGRFFFEKETRSRDMFMLIKYFLPVSLVILMLGGCQTQQPAPPTFYQSAPEPVFPAVNFFGMKPSAALAEQCNERKCYTNTHFLDGIYAQFQSSKMFQDISTGPSAQNEYSVFVVVREFSNESIASGAAKGALAGATLLLVPQSDNREYHSEFVVTWRGVKIAEYSFVTPFAYKLSLYDPPDKQNNQICERIAAEFISLAQGDNAFSSERIYSVLKAEDYHKDLKPPLQIGNYRHRDFRLYPDPRAGVQLRYENQKSSQEIADVFVYPIRQADWSDAVKVASDEMNVALKDIDLAVKGDVYKSAQFSSPKVVSLGSGNKLRKGWMSVGKVDWLDGKTTTDFVYVFTMKDKYLKFRFSLSDSAPDAARLNEFVSGFIDEAVIPDESFFMASLRQKQRSSLVK